MPNRSKQKGNRFELDCVHQAQAIGLKAYRYPTSKAPENDNWDICVAGRQVQCKVEGSGFKRIQKWMEGVDAVIVGADYKPSFVVMRLEEWLKML